MSADSSTKDLLDLNLDELVNVEVTSASRFKQKSSEAPSAVEVLTAEDFRNYGWRTLADALNAIRGLNTRNDRNYTYLGVRGFSRTGDFTSRILIMVDGRRMNEAIYDGGYIGEEFLLDTNVIDHIEYIPGSGSAVYGANALLGVVNVVTKSGKDVDGFRLSGEAGSLDTYRGRATFGKRWDNGAEVLINGSHFASQGADKLFFPEFRNINGGIVENMDRERSDRVFGKFSYGDFTLRGGWIDRKKLVPTAAFGAIFGDKTFSTTDRQYYADLDYNTQINDDLGFEARAFHHWYYYYSYQTYDGNAGTPPLARAVNFDAVNSRWWGGELKLTGTQFKDHKWLAGIDLQYDDRQRLINYDIEPSFTLYNNSNNHGWRAGVYAQDEWRITDNLLLNAGLRLDHHHMIKNLQLHPRIGLIWDATPTLTTKLLYGSAFRAPNIYERDYRLLDSNVPNPNNREELVYSYEAVAEWRPGNGVKLLGTAFYNDLEQVLVQDSSLKFVNAGTYHTYGFELGGEKRWENGRHLKLTWTHNFVRDENLGGGSWAQDSPRNLVKLHYTEPLFDDTLRLGFEEIFVDERRTLANNIASGYHLFNINLGLTKPIYGFQAGLTVYNVLDQRFKVLGGSEHVPDTLAIDGRTVRFRLEYGF